MAAPIPPDPIPNPIPDPANNKTTQRWGSGDELGNVNYINTDTGLGRQNLRKALNAVNDHRIFELSHVNEQGTRGFVPGASEIDFATGTLGTFNSTNIQFWIETLQTTQFGQLGTQMDGFNHGVRVDGIAYNGFDTQDPANRFLIEFNGGGAAVSISLVSGTTFRLTDPAAAFTSSAVGQTLEINDAPSAGNNSLSAFFVITAQTATTLDYTNASGVAESFAAGSTYSGPFRGIKSSGLEKMGTILAKAHLIDLLPIHRDNVGDPLAFPDHNVDYSPEDLEAALARQGMGTQNIRRGDVLLIRTGWGSAFWTDNPTGPKNDQQRYFNGGLPLPALALATSPGMTIRAGKWLSDRQPMLVGADNTAIDVTGPDFLRFDGDGVPLGYPGYSGILVFPVHSQLQLQGILQIEHMDLDELADACEADGNFTFMFVAQPIRLKGSAVCNVYPIAVR